MEVVIKGMFRLFNLWDILLLINYGLLIIIVVYILCYVMCVKYI